jgi:hypothetical protein
VVYDGLIYAYFSIRRFEKFLVIFFVPPPPPKGRLKNEELEDLASQLTQKQHQQEQEMSISRSTETRDLQEILAEIDNYLQSKI